MFYFFIYIKKVKFYVAVAIYELLLLIFICLPIAIDKPPTYFLAKPISIVFLIFALTVIASYISVEIFRTPIDDGSELLVFSKPIRRISIFLSKTIIIFIFAIITCLVSLPITGIAFAFKDSVYQYSMLALGGVPVASLLIFLIFASLSTFVSMFLKKAHALITLTSISIFLLLFSIINFFALDISAKKSVTLDDYYRSYPLSLDYSENADGSKSVKSVNIYSGVYSTDAISLSDTYKQLASQKIYPSLLPINFYTQFSNFFSLNQLMDNFGLDDSIGTSALNYPFYPKFYTDIFKTSSDDSSALIQNPYLNISFPNSASATDSGSFDISMFFNISNYGEIYNYDTETETYLSSSNYSKILTSGVNVSSKMETFLDCINESWQSFVNTDPTIANSSSGSTTSQTSKNDFQNYINFFSSINTIASNAFELWYEKTSNSYQNDEDLLNDLILITLNLFAYVDTNIDMSEIDTIVSNWSKEGNTYLSSSQDNVTDEILNLVKLKFLGLSFYQYVKTVNTYVNDNNYVSSDESSITPWDFLNPNSIVYDESKVSSLESELQDYYISFSYDDTDGSQPDIVYWLDFSPESTTLYTNLEVMEMNSYFNTFGLYFCWIFFAFLLFFGSYLIYRKKDFK